MKRKYLKSQHKKVAKILPAWAPKIIWFAGVTNSLSLRKRDADSAQGPPFSRPYNRHHLSGHSLKINWSQWTTQHSFLPKCRIIVPLSNRAVIRRVMELPSDYTQNVSHSQKSRFKFSGSATRRRGALRAKLRQNCRMSHAKLPCARESLKIFAFEANLRAIFAQVCQHKSPLYLYFNLTSYYLLILLFLELADKIYSWLRGQQLRKGSRLNFEFIAFRKVLTCLTLQKLLVHRWSKKQKYFFEKSYFVLCI